MLRFQCRSDADVLTFICSFGVDILAFFGVATVLAILRKFWLFSIFWSPFQQQNMVCLGL